MVLVDTFVWIDHFRRREPTLERQLESGRVLMHPFVIGELACGNMKYRDSILSLLNDLPAAIVSTDDETLLYIERQDLMGKGIAYIDVHLLAASALTAGARLWTRDKRLHVVAESLGIAWHEPLSSH